ncbi:MAG: LapA family protein [Pseudomonadota bacterium]
MRAFGLIVYFVVIAVVVTLGVVFAVDNSVFITLKFYKWQVPQMSLWIIIFSAFFIGFLTATIILSWKLIKLSLSRKKYINSYEKLKAMLQQKMEDLKNPEEENH